MAYQLRWLQPRDGSHVQQHHDFDTLDEAKEFGQGLGADAQPQVFEDANEKPVWSYETPQATMKERDAARQANVVGKSEGSGPNTKPDTRGDSAQDLKEVMGNKSQRDGIDTAKPADAATGASPQGARQLDADKAPKEEQRPQDGSGNKR